MSERPGFFPSGQCRHFQLVDGWAKVWCIRTAPHTTHETPDGVSWTADDELGAPRLITDEEGTTNA